MKRTQQFKHAHPQQQPTDFPYEAQGNPYEQKRVYPQYAMHSAMPMGHGPPYYHPVPFETISQTSLSLHTTQHHQIPMSMYPMQLQGPIHGQPMKQRFLEHQMPHPMPQPMQMMHGACYCCPPHPYQMHPSLDPHQHHQQHPHMKHRNNVSLGKHAAAQQGRKRDSKRSEKLTKVHHNEAVPREKKNASYVPEIYDTGTDQVADANLARQKINKYEATAAKEKLIYKLERHPNRGNDKTPVTQVTSQTQHYALQPSAMQDKKTGSGSAQKPQIQLEQFDSFCSAETHQQFNRNELFKQKINEQQKKRLMATEPSHFEKGYITKGKLEQDQPKEGGFTELSQAKAAQQSSSWEEQSQVTQHDLEEEAISHLQPHLAGLHKEVFINESHPNKYVLKGQLEYDPILMASDESFPHCISEEQVSINIVYPSHEFQAENNEFKKRHESMQKEADEHYRLLVDLQLSDPLFNKMLLDSHNRKQSVEKKLGESRNWHNFIRLIDPSLN